MTTPQDFDVDAWLNDAERPARSVTVYQKAGLIAELDALEEQIKNAEGEEVDGPSMGGGVGTLRAKYADLAQKFHDSALTVKVQSLTNQEQAELLKGNDSESMADRGAVVLAEAIVYPKVTAAQVKRLNSVLGDAQFTRIMDAWHSACREAPEVSADFLPRRSTPGDGGES
jgi:hypothetical protein